MTGEIAIDPREVEARVATEPGDGLGLIVADLQQKGTIRHEQTRPRGETIDDRPIGVEPVGAAVQRCCRIVSANLLGKRRDHAACDVGGSTG